MPSNCAGGMKHNGGACRAAGIALIAALGFFGIASMPSARADTCAANIPGQPASPTPGHPCWADVNDGGVSSSLPDVTQYPFGFDGSPVASGDPHPSDYLTVTSMAFRAWNRGRAAANGNSSPYNMWLFNGTRWYPDPTFPGPSVCSGNTVLWAGKLDYWLIGGTANPNDSNNGSGLCRFDGVNYQWEPFVAPAASIERAALAGGTLSINAGACFAWNNCWFFGNYGVVDHWDGQTLRDVSPGLGDSPWLMGTYTAAAAGVDASGDPYSLAVTDSSAVLGGPPLPPQPDGSPAPQVFSSFSGAFAPLSSNPLGGVTADLSAVALDDKVGGWIAGSPPAATNGQTSAPPPSPLLPVTATGGAASSCTAGEGPSAPDYGPDDFTPSASGQPWGSGRYSWRALSVFPNSGAALAGGTYIDPKTGTTGEDPVLVIAECGQSPQVVRAPADVGGWFSAVTANASNSAWAAVQTAGTAGGSEPPHLYALTDGQPPDAPPGNDEETRPLVFQIDPTIFVQSPGVVPPPAATVTTTTQQQTVTKRVKQKPAIYDVKAGKPVVGRDGRITLTISFLVRTPVTVGLEGLRGHKVVSSSGLRHFGRGKGHLALVLDRKRWPTRLKFITPHAGKLLADVEAPSELTWTARIPA